MDDFLFSKIERRIQSTAVVVLFGMRPLKKTKKMDSNQDTQYQDSYFCFYFRAPYFDPQEKPSKILDGSFRCIGGRTGPECRKHGRTHERFVVVHVKNPEKRQTIRHEKGNIDHCC
jgi:hypothetical protein